MNKIFKIIWSKALNQLVVTSELSRGEGKATKTSESKVGSQRASVLKTAYSAVSLAVLAALPTTASAFLTAGAGQVNGNFDDPTTVENSGIAISGGQASYGGTAIGYGTKAQGRGSVAIGIAANAHGETGVKPNNAIAIGNEAVSQKGAIALGQNANAFDYGVAIGQNANAGLYGSVAIGGGSVAKLGGTTNNTSLQEAFGGSLSVNNVSQTYQYANGGATRIENPEKAGEFSRVVAFNGRQLQDIAAGQITNTSTDAVNGSQLFAVAKYVNDLATQTVFNFKTKQDSADPADAFTWTLDKEKNVTFAANGPLAVESSADNTITYSLNTTKFAEDASNNITLNDGNVTVANGGENKIATAGDVAKAINAAVADAKANSNSSSLYGADNSTDSANNITRSSTEKLTIAGGATTLSDNNIGTVADSSTGKVTVKLAKALTGLTSATFGEAPNTTTINKDGVTITNDGKTVTLTKDGLTGIESKLTKDSNDLVDLSKPTDGTAPAVSDNTAATVGDLRNMGWVVSAGDDYSATVKNANEVKFVGTGAAKVSGETEGDVRTITVDVDTQAITNEALDKSPIEYVNANGDKVIKEGDNYYTVTTGDDGQPVKTEVSPSDVKTALKDPDGKGGSTLTNVADNLPTPNATANTKPDVSNIGNNAANINDVLNAGWNLKEKTAGTTTDKDFVKPYDTIVFADGTGTTANVVTGEDGTSSEIKFNVKTATFETGANGVTAKNADGVPADATDTFATAAEVARVINEAAAASPLTTVDPEGNEVVKVGDNWYKKSDLENGQPKDGVSPVDAADVTTALKDPSGSTTNPGTLTNVTSGLGTTEGGKADGLVDLSKPTDGAAPAVSDNTAATVGDLRNMGWVVSAGDDYSAAVKNANEVKFVGANGAKVTGATAEDGVRTITVDVDTQSVLDKSPIEYVNAAGEKVVQDKDGNWYKPSDLNSDGTPKANTTAVEPKDVKTALKDPTNGTDGATLTNIKDNLTAPADANATSGTKPANAGDIGNNAANINDVLNAGWNLQANGEAKDFVRPYDTVNFVNGNGATVTVTPNEDGSSSDIRIDTPLAYVGTDGKTETDGKPNTATNTVKLVGKEDAPVTLTNVKAGSVAKGSTDAINGDQLFDIKNILGDSTTVNDDGSISAQNIGGTNANNINDAIAAVKNIADSATAAAGKKTVVKAKADQTNIKVEKVADTDGAPTYEVSMSDTLNVTSVTAGNTTVNNAGVTISNTDPKKAVSLTETGLNNGGNAISNVASGLNGKTLDDIKNDANAPERNNVANVADLLAVQETLQGDMSSITNNFNKTIGEDFVNQDGSLNDAGKDALKTYDTAGQTVTKNENVISAIKNMNENGIKYFHTNDGQVASGTAETKDSSAAGKYSTAVGYNSKVGKDAENSVAIGANNEVNTANTYALGSNIKQTVANSVFLGNKAASAGVNTGNVSYQGRNNANVAGVDNVVGVVSVGNENETRQIQNVAAGVISATSTDAVNGSQLYDTHKNINRLENAVTNMGNELGNRINHVDRKLRAGVAGAVATAGLPQAYIPGKSMVAVAGGTYRGENAIAVGASRISDNGKVILKLTGSSNSRGDLSGSVGVGYQW
ncbi:YadA-like family protein [Avibacterium sp. 21-594]|uniref:YadA-like family protein n=1 Tax=Avibacterium sp. 21-594 TaxID=2911535 RepID=UPI0022480275|nr:YadA-like family protein [Avibacterium sp. 21-594]MCW9716375.1 YadA-like family protein [Avibacterium sp. 21-594]